MLLTLFELEEIFLHREARFIKDASEISHIVLLYFFISKFKYFHSIFSFLIYVFLLFSGYKLPGH